MSTSPTDPPLSASQLGQAQYAGVQRSWPEVATLLEQVATLEERLLAVCQSW